MEKNVFMAIILSVVVLVSWQLLVTKVYHIDNKDVVAKSVSTEPSQGAALEPNLQRDEPIPTQAKQQDIELGEIETSKAIIKIVNPGAKISNAYFKDYNLNFLVGGGLNNRSFGDKPYTLQKSNGSFLASYAQNGHFISKKFSINENNYVIDLEVVYKNTTFSDWTFADKFIISTVSEKVDPSEGGLFEAVFLKGNNFLRKNPLKIKNKFISSERFEALGFRDRYSCIIVQPENKAGGDLGFYIEKRDEGVELGLGLDNIIIPAGGQEVYRYRVYCGPQDVNILKKLGLGFDNVVHFGGFNLISNALLSVLRFFYRLWHSWGLALISLSFFVFLVLFPLTLKQQNSMKQMQILQPKIEALRNSYKDNPQRLNKEIIELYKKHKANPFGGCLPTILQIPIFFGLYQALSRSIELKGSSFLWIKDLAEPDRLFLLPFELPFDGGKHFNLLPVLMAAAMFFQQKLSLKRIATSSEAAAQQQKMMLVAMPILFGVIFYKFPSGLTMYWFINTILSAVPQWKNTEKVDLDTTG